MSDIIRTVKKAITSLILTEPFFGILATRLRQVVDPSCDTAWTDGTTLGVNPQYVESISSPELIGLVCHEVFHCASGHPWRRGGRDPRQWNVAADFAINSEIKRAGFTLPQGALLDPSYDGRSAEWIHDRLPKQPKGRKGNRPGEPGNEPSGDGIRHPGKGDDPIPGEVRDAPPDSKDGKGEGNSEEDWKQAVIQAAKAAEAQGKLSAGLARFVGIRSESALDWRSVLRRFVQQTARSDYSWTRPNPRYVSSGLYLPSLRSEEMGPMVVAIDTSGSIDDVALAQFGSELQAIADESQPSRITVFYCDSQIRRTDTFERGEPVTLKPEGGGGTSFVPVFLAMGELDEPPLCIVYLTDMLGTFPGGSDVPTLWVRTGTRRIVPPFGEVVPCN